MSPESLVQSFLIVLHIFTYVPFPSFTCDSLLLVLCFSISFQAIFVMSLDMPLAYISILHVSPFQSSPYPALSFLSFVIPDKHFIFK